MYKVLKLINILAFIYVSAVLRGKNVYVVTGLRRSGNHAFINWFVSSMEDKDIIFDRSATQGPALSAGDTLLFNESNHGGLLSFIGVIRSSKPAIKNASNIIISLEDYTPQKNDPYVPWGAQKISIMRSTLNVAASRLQKSLKAAKSGQDRGDMALDQSFVANLDWLARSPEYGWNVWNYDDWLNDKNGFRAKFLAHYGFSYDCDLGMSTFGNGSSFTGAQSVPDKKELASRWKMVRWPRRVLKLLHNHAALHLKDEEIQFVREKLDLLPPDTREPAAHETSGAKRGGAQEHPAA